MMVQFPILTLLVLAPFAEKVQQVERQRQAVEAIREVGGHVQYDRFRYPAAKPEPPVRAWSKRLVGEDYFSDVVAVDLRPRSDEVGSVLLGQISALTKLVYLVVRA